MTGSSLLECGPAPLALPSESEANQELAALDQGLRCPRPGEQSEAIVRFPSLFAKFPFPILINSALLKLADVFRQGTNFLRLSVLRVLQESERHLDKITNVDEFLRRIVTVLHSNDPVARALALRTLGAIAVIIPERKQVHHNIRNALDSHDTVEVLAAIHAAGKFAAQSKAFSVNICAKLSDMLRGYATPLDMKLRLVPVFQNMHHEASTSQSVRATCLAMLPGYPSEAFTLTVLHTLTILSAHTMVEVLLHYLNNDPRHRIKRMVLDDLKYLANESHAHLWSESNVASLVSFSVEASKANKEQSTNDAQATDAHLDEEKTLCEAFSVLCELMKHTNTEKFDLASSHSPVIQLTSTCCYSQNFTVAARSTQLLTLVAANCKKDLHHIEGMDVINDAVNANEALFIAITSGLKSVPLNVLKECLQCIVDLCHIEVTACDQFVDVVGGQLISTVESPDMMVMLCKLLAALGNLREGVLKLLLPDICHIMMTTGSWVGDVPSLLATLLLQTLKGHSWTEEYSGAMDSMLSCCDLWTCYKVARAANRYGHHELASKVYALCAGRVCTEQNYFWLSGLEQMSQGEAKLNNSDNPDLIERFAEANADILLGVGSITAGTTQSKSQEFQIQYLKCRSEMLTSLSHLISACHSLRISPPPAIASAQAKHANDDLQRCGRITTLLRESIKEFDLVGQMYSDLASASFDADPTSLALIQLQAQLAISISHWIEMVCLKSSMQGNMFSDLDRIEFSMEAAGLKPDGRYGLEISGFLTMCKLVAREFHQLWRNPNAGPPINHAHTGCLLRVCALLASAAMPIPRFFFQSLQQTSLKLAVTPQPRSVGEPVSVSNATQMSIKVEGVVTSGCQLKEPWRRVRAVNTTLTSNLLNVAKSVQIEYSQSGRKIPDCAVRLEQRSEPHNDFFSCQFLLPFPVAGSHQVTIDTQLEDVDGRLWRAGQKTTITVKAYEDVSNRTNAQRAQQQPMPGQSR